MFDFLKFPVVASAHGPEIDDMMTIMHIAMLILFVGWSLFYLFILVRFRRSKQPRADYSGMRTHASNYVEGAIVLFEVIVLVGLAFPLWAKRVNAFPSEKDALVLRVVGEQFNWNVHYPGGDGAFGRTDIKLVSAENPLGLDRSDPNAKDDITTINQLHVPVNKPVIVRLSSKDVIHSFSLPFFRVKQDAIPGDVFPVWFVPTKTTKEIQEMMRFTYNLGKVVEFDYMRDDILDYLDYVTLTDIVNQKDSSVALPKGTRIQTFLKDQLDQAVKDGAEFTRIKLVDVPPALIFEKIAARVYSAKDGSVLLNKGDLVNESIIPALFDNDITEIIVELATPTEVACAQLCGLGHYRMRGTMIVETQQEYEAWLKQEASFLPQ
ncbi:MAG: cytochrome c oxidase subunit II [Bacteroidota bacterium]